MELEHFGWADALEGVPTPNAAFPHMPALGRAEIVLLPPLGGGPGGPHAGLAERGSAPGWADRRG